MCIVLFNLQKIFLQPSEVIKFKSYIKHEMLDEKKISLSVKSEQVYCHSMDVAGEFLRYIDF